MSRAVPQPPHPSAPFLDQAGLVEREWYDWIEKFASVVKQNTPLTGSASLAGTTTVAVGFATAEASASYIVVFEFPANNTFWVSSKATTGFTLNASATSTVSVRWSLMRD